MPHTIPFGTSEPQDFALANNRTPLVGTSLTVAIEIKRLVAGGALEDVETPPVVSWLSAAAGTVRVTGTEVLAVGVYAVRFKLIDGGGDVGFAPNTPQPDLWHVVRVP